MENKKMARYGFIHSIGVLVYISLVEMVMQNGDRLIYFAYKPV